LLMAATSQRLRDLYIDDLQRLAGGRSRVHFPHLYINLQKRSAYCLPDGVCAAIEAKIRRRERWTCIEKGWVLGARHEQTIRLILAYALSRAYAEKRTGGVWINLGMNTGAQGHANSVCLQTAADGTAKAFLYDPNYAPKQEHWVHAQKAINDALPGVRRLLHGTGIPAPERAELFGNGLQTSLGTTERHQGWFSSKITITHRGFPICGSVVHLLASVWCAASGGAATDSLVDVEAALADIVASGPEGKALVQRRIASLLEDLGKRFGDRGEEPFAQTMPRRLDRDKREWPSEVVAGGGSITMTGAGGRTCTYAW